MGVLVEVSGEKTTLYSIDSDSDLALAMTTYAQSGTEIITDSQVENAQFTTPISTNTNPSTTCICTTSTSTTESGTKEIRLCVVAKLYFSQQQSGSNRIVVAVEKMYVQCMMRKTK